MSGKSVLERNIKIDNSKNPHRSIPNVGMNPSSICKGNLQ